MLSLVTYKLVKYDIGAHIYIHIHIHITMRKNDHVELTLCNSAGIRVCSRVRMHRLRFEPF